MFLGCAGVVVLGDQGVGLLQCNGEQYFIPITK